MATQFPEDLDDFSNPSATDELTGHAELHSNINDAIEAIQTKVGVDGSTDANSLDYKVTTLEESITSLSNNTDTITTLLGLEGNNDLTISGIENKTTVDSFPVGEWKTIKYEIQITRGSSVYSSSILVLADGANIGVSESNIISNTDQSLANVTFEENSGIISLCVTPVTTAVTVRYYRTALKA
jgi:hypothetical protein